jgi:hypothetical protein
MFARLGQIAVVVLALAVGGQAKAAPLSYGTYYDEEFVQADCAGKAACQSNFTQLPSDHLVLLKKVNCTIQTSQPVAVVTVSIAQTFGGTQFGRGIFINPGPGVLSNSVYYYMFQTDAQILIGQGRYPFVEVQTPTNSSLFFMNCGILGDLVTPIQ